MMVGRQEGWFDGRKARGDGFMVGRRDGLMQKGKK
jgi:hypothetical protein